MPAGVSHRPTSPNRSRAISSSTPKTVYATAPAVSRLRSRSTSVSTAATPKATSQAATARAVSGVSVHGQSVRAVDGAT